MADLVSEVLNKSNINVINCREQSYDNASNMSGTYKRMQAKIKKHCKYADYCTCPVYLLNIVEESAAYCCIESANFFFNYQLTL